MEPTYTMIGADGQQYGPVTLAQLNSWIAEGRVTAVTKILRSDTQSWLPAADYRELGFGAPNPLMAPPPLPSLPRSTAVIGDSLLISQSRSGAQWFYWIAGLSLLNALSGQLGISFLLGELGASELSYRIVHQMGLGSSVAIALNVAVSGVYAVFGFFAAKGQHWSYITGAIIYGLDGLYLFNVGWYLPLVIHAILLVWILRGLKANLALRSPAQFISRS